MVTVPATIASKLTFRTLNLWSPNIDCMHRAMSYSYPDVTFVGSLSLPSQKPGPGRLVTTDSVSAFTGLKLAAAAGFTELPHCAANAPVVSVGEVLFGGVVLLLAGLLLLEHAARPVARARAKPMTANLRTGGLLSVRSPIGERRDVRSLRRGPYGWQPPRVGNIRVMIDEQETVHAVLADFDTIFTWDYERSRGSLVKLYEKAKTSQWNATTDLDWSIDVDPEKIGRELGGGGVARFQALRDAEGSPVKHFGDKEWRQVSVEIQNSLLSQFMHGEQGALLCTGPHRRDGSLGRREVLRGDAGDGRSAARRGVRRATSTRSSATSTASTRI